MNFIEEEPVLQPAANLEIFDLYRICNATAVYQEILREGFEIFRHVRTLQGKS